MKFYLAILCCLSMAAQSSTFLNRESIGHSLSNSNSSVLASTSQVFNNPSNGETGGAITAPSSVHLTSSERAATGEATRELLANDTRRPAVSFESTTNNGLLSTAQVNDHTSTLSSGANTATNSMSAEQTSNAALCMKNPCDKNPCEHNGECIGLLFAHGSIDFICLYAFTVECTVRTCTQSN